MRITTLLITVLVSLFGTVSHAANTGSHGVSLPNGAVRVSEDRFRLPDSLEASLKWYKSVYRPEKYLRTLITNQPGLKAYHVSNPDPKGEWEGFNLYSYQGETRLYVLGRTKK
jgi:hypothetical protein